ncbi:acyltransferase domain-containing protein [Actinopolyspora mortivallis]|uniref:Carrier domain-containing protein n=1 Tax=Actinopolyspora mortivallis TaxID=33906 RepID=A0A2T0GTC2_ACTMO|nr:acyltransferase domain-containing protein [Actinopolyspora mortivallis]PRW62365.1 hypothetical protein CEP50_15915 [Actinopolyspora mortivallis]
MAEKTAHLFPGQGAYRPGALGPLARRHAVVGDVLGRVDSVSAEYGVNPISALLTEDGPDIDTLIAHDPEALHMAIFAGSMAVHTLLTEVYGVDADVLVGHSLGEITALVAGGAYTLADGARVLCERDRLLRTSSRARGGLLVVGLPADRAQALITASGEWDAEIAAVNAPYQTVVSAPVEVLERLLDAASSLGASTTRVKSPYLFHNSLLNPIAGELAPSLRGIPVQPMHTKVFSTLHKRVYTSGDDIPSLLLQHLTAPVYFLDAVRHLHAYGVTFFAECGMGRALTGMVRASVPGSITAAPLAGEIDVDSVDAEVRRVGGTSATPSPAAAPRTPETPEATTKAPESLSGTNDVTETSDTSEDPHTSRPSRDRDELLEQLRQLFAESLEYPVDVLTPDADLEADLGVDSVKRNELLQRARDRYELAELPENFRITEYTTLDEITTLVQEMGEW